MSLGFQGSMQNDIQKQTIATQAPPGHVVQKGSLEGYMTGVSEFRYAQRAIPRRAAEQTLIGIP